MKVRGEKISLQHDRTQKKQHRDVRYHIVDCFKNEVKYILIVSDTVQR